MQFHDRFQAFVALSALVLAMPAQALERADVPARWLWRRSA